MRIARLINMGIIIVGCILNCIIVMICFTYSIKVKKSNAEEINSGIVITLITIDMVLFIIYGLTRNIE